MQPEFRAYQEQVIDNARVMAKVLQERGLRIVAGAPTATCCWWICGPSRSPARRPRRCWAGAHHGEQERHSERSAEALCHQRHPHRHARR